VPEPKILAINVGSSSVRLTLFDGDARRERHLDANAGAPAALLDDLGDTPELVVHRVVHGGPRLRATTIVDDAVVRELLANVALAPLHLPRALEWLQAARRRWPRARQAAAFDTAFYATLPPAARTYALPRALSDKLGLQRYGFHGLAHQSMLRALPPAPRVITFQLGAGASATASRDGRAVDTSMGFSPLEGLVMATRPGDVDPGVLLYLMRHGYGVDALDALLEHESGLRGLGGDGDLRQLAARQDDAARLALDVYVRRARKYLGAYLVALGGCDAIAFGGGVGEHAPTIRAAICDGLAWAGITIDDARNRAASGDSGGARGGTVVGASGGTVGGASGGARRIDAGGAVAVWVVPVDEAAVMRDEAIALLHEVT
jgi:acetate kinase